jgi:hypothetical protein
MATATKKPQSTSAGKTQAATSLTGLRHTDYAQTYGGQVQQLDLMRQKFRVTAITDTGTYDLGPYCTEVIWEEQSADVPTYSNQYPPLTGSVSMTKPALWQYATLLPEVFSAMVNPKTKSARYGALGVVIRLDVMGSSQASQWEPLWAMRCVPGGSTAADSVELGDEGSWTINLADDLQILAMSTAWFKFTKGKKTHRMGWLANEIAAAVCREFNVPVKSLAQGTAYLDLPVSTTSDLSPMLMIAGAYDGETAKTGKAYIVRWSAPDDQYPMGALEVVPYQRNSALLTFRSQITDATLSRTINGNFATWITAIGTVKQPKGKHKRLQYEAKNDQAIQRFGLVHRREDFHSVSGMAELKILATRQLAYDLAPIRAAEITNMGVATVRRGDAVKINIPEEGYGDIDVAISTVPASVNNKDNRHGKQNKQSLSALQAAAANDPTIFAVPNVNVLSQKTAKDLENSLQSATDVPITVANQGIAFVSSVTHTLTPGNYSMDMIMSFQDILDPIDLQAEMDSNIRAAKLATAAAKATTTSGGSGSAGSLGATGSSTGGSSSAGYVQPIDTNLTLERTDEGVDFGGAGTLKAIGDCTVVGWNQGTGWFGGYGNCLVYRITDGAKSGTLVYYAEGVELASGTAVGRSYSAGTVLCNATGGQYGIECGWASDSTGTPLTPYNGNPDGTPMPGGIDFGNFIAGLGYPYHKITDITG